jgi:iron-sulfur cluster repair protein YtfE (RIC family)
MLNDNFLNYNHQNTISGEFMESILEYLTGDHRRIDTVYAQLEDAVVEKEEENIKKYYADFSASMEKHLKGEEEIMFPAFEKTTGNSMGPTQVMRLEHGQMRELISAMGRAVEANDNKKLQGLLETMMILIQQHNMKEEQILYPMIDRTMGAEASELVGAMKNIS